MNIRNGRRERRTNKGKEISKEGRRERDTLNIYILFFWESAHADDHDTVSRGT